MPPKKGRALRNSAAVSTTSTLTDDATKNDIPEINDKTGDDGDNGNKGNDGDDANEGKTGNDETTNENKPNETKSNDSHSSTTKSTPPVKQKKISVS